MQTTPGESYRLPLAVKRSDLERHIENSDRKLYVVTNYQLHPRNFNRYPHHAQLSLYLSEIDPQSATSQIEEIVRRQIQRQQAYTEAPFLLLIDEPQNIAPAIIEAAIAAATRPESDLDFSIAFTNTERGSIPNSVQTNEIEYIIITN